MVLFLGSREKKTKFVGGDLSALEQAIVLLEKPRLAHWNMPGSKAKLVKVDEPRWDAYEFFEARKMAPPKVLDTGMFAHASEPEQYVPIALTIGERVLSQVYDAPKVTTGLALIFNAEYRTLVENVQTAEEQLVTLMREHSTQYLQRLAKTVQKKTEEFTQRMGAGHSIAGLDGEVRSVIRASERINRNVFPKTFGDIEGRALLSEGMDAIRDSILMYEQNKETLVAERIAKTKRSEQITQYIQNTLSNLRDAIMPNPSIPTVQKIAFFRQHFTYSQDAFKQAKTEGVTLGVDLSEIKRAYHAANRKLKAEAIRSGVPGIVMICTDGQLDFFPRNGEYEVDKADGHAYQIAKEESLAIPIADDTVDDRTLPLFRQISFDPYATELLLAYQGSHLPDLGIPKSPQPEYRETIRTCAPTATLPAYRGQVLSDTVKDLPVYQAEPATHDQTTVGAHFDASATAQYVGAVVTSEYALLETLDLHDDDPAGETIELADLTHLVDTSGGAAIQAFEEAGLGHHLEDEEWLIGYATHAGITSAYNQAKGVWCVSSLLAGQLNMEAAERASDERREDGQLVPYRA